MIGLLLLILANQAGKRHEPSDAEKQVLIETERWLVVFLPLGAVLVGGIALILFIHQLLT